MSFHWHLSDENRGHAQEDSIVADQGAHFEPVDVSSGGYEGRQHAAEYCHDIIQLPAPSENEPTSIGYYEYAIATVR